ncbi:MAG: T9SS type A sorting domain-containing protein [Bacteroidetes bacterium]|nr:T9SS type A sorting domain-containing protein [Bacteroidota bacterium]
MKLLVSICALLCSSVNFLHAQTYCSANSNGAGNVYGGNVLSLMIQDDTGIMYSYYGFTNNSTNLVINSGSPYKMVSWDTFIFSMTGISDSTGNTMFTKAGIWIDMNRDGDFSASECIADPESGPFKHLRKDSATSMAIRIPGPFNTGNSRIRIRGAANNQTLTASDGCGTLSVYGNQIDFEVTLYQGTNRVQTIGSGKSNFSIFPNPCDGLAKLQYNISGTEKAEISISDFSGKCCYKQTENISGQGLLDLHLAVLQVGFYIVKIHAGNAIYYRNLQIN